MSLLDVQGLAVDLPVGGGRLHAVRGIDFSVEKGETLCLVGESGCGKSLTSLAMMGLLPSRARRRAKRLSFDGIDLTTLREREMSKLRGDRISMIFQEPMTSLNPAYTIGNQLAEVFLRHRSASPAEARARAVHLLETVGITAAESRLGQFPHQLSGGLRQRVMIAMALMCEPDLIIADEPTTALDVTIQAQILLLMRRLQQEIGMAMILVTHDLGVVSRVAHKVAVMYAGEVVEYGPVEDIFRRPAHPYTRGLLDCIPVPGRTEPGARLGAIPGIVPSLIGSVNGCAFRDRCPMADTRCGDAAPMHNIGRGHDYRCWHAPEAMLEREAS
ncbi:MAG: ABC transporter ATP-binding protein [Pseudomonadota bacterium]